MLILFIVIAAYFFIQSIAGFYVDLQWFGSHNQVNTFWTLFYGKFNVAVIFAFIFMSLFALNFLLIRVIGGSGRIFTRNILDRLQVPVFGTPKRALFIILALGVIVTGTIMGMGASAFWKEYLMYIHSVPFEGFPPDPIFNHDIGFYVFSLPFFRFLYHWMMISLVIITIFSTLFHLVNGGITVQQGKPELSLFTRAHLSSLTAMIVLLHGIGYRLSAYDLLFSEKLKFFGAGYSDIHARLLSFNVCMIISFIAAALLIFNIFKRSFKLPVLVLLTLIPVYFVMGTVYPSLQQRFIVEPNELEREKVFIENNIRFTRLAYNLNTIKEKEFPNISNLTYKDIINNKNTLENIRLWDWRPLKSTYKQLQALKPYYYFNDVDVDRYTIDGRKVAVNLSARELATGSLGGQSQSWVNQHLIYTHGFGLVLSRVDRITPEGMPEFLIHDIPPKLKVDISLEKSELYFGEHNNPYAVVNTSIQPGEFNYPSGEENKFTRYSGTGGVLIGNFFQRLMFTVAFGNINILITGSITDQSRILYWRNITQMVRTLTPFLMFDDDPYLVISGGKLFWIIDAYTVTDNFPYSAPLQISGAGRINYIRNSVKIIIDAYEGSIRYYIMDPSDPIIRVYSRIFPGLFLPLTDMTDDLKEHLRYPEDLFNIQSAVLLRYHMKNVNVFYNNEDLWTFAKQLFEDREDLVHSYYQITKLPGEDRSEFLLMVPFTPARRDNMVGFLVAKCDQPYYGEMTLFLLPKDKLTYGPMQVEARINQDPDISKELSLWSQRGSNLIRGNMIVIPIENSLLMVEPLYLKAEQSEMPELRRVFVSYSDRLVMEPNLNTALERLFLDRRFSRYTGMENSTEKESHGSYARRAYYHLMQAEKYQREGQWGKYGEELKTLKNILNAMKDIGE